MTAVENGNNGTPKTNGNNSHSNGSAATPEKPSVAPIAKEISANGAAAVVATDDNEKIEAKVSEQNGVVSCWFFSSIFLALISVFNQLERSSCFYSKVRIFWEGHKFGKRILIETFSLFLSRNRVRRRVQIWGARRLRRNAAWTRLSSPLKRNWRLAKKMLPRSEQPPRLPPKVIYNKGYCQLGGCGMICCLGLLKLKVEKI